MIQIPGAVDHDNRAFVNAWDEVSFWCSRFGAALLDAVELRPGTVGLDIACGTGFPVIELAQMHGPSGRFVGVDIWRPAVERAVVKRDTYGVPNVAFVLADGTALPFAAATFNLLTMNLGVNNMSDVEGVLAEAGRVAAPGARFLLTSNVEGHMAEFYAVLRSVLVSFGLSDRLPMVDEHERHRLAPAVLEEMLSRRGFVDFQTSVSTFQLRYLDFDALLGHLLTRIGFLPSWRALVPADSEVEVFAEVGRRLGSPISLSATMMLMQCVRGCEPPCSGRTR